MRVLVVAYYFPPVGGGGVNRTLKLVRGMLAAGWAPIVLSVDRAAWTQDPRLLDQVPDGVRVLRLPNPDWGRVAAWMRRGADRCDAPRSASPGRLRRWLIPDLNVGWSALTLPVAAAMSGTRAVDLVYTTCPPYSANAAGWLSHALGVPWVADFRDSWIDCPTRGDLPPWRRALEADMEARVLRDADQVLFASDGARARAIGRIPELAARSETVLTGFDASDYAGQPEGAAPGGPLEVVHAGSVLLNHMSQTLDRLLEALAHWSARDPGVRAALRLRFVGGEPKLAERFEAAGVSDWVRVEPAIPRSGLAPRLRRAHLALMFASAARHGEDPIPGKLFDAVGAGLPILALTPAGALSELIERRGLGHAVAPDDAEAIVGVLSSLRDAVLQGERIPGPPETSRLALSNERAVQRAMAAMKRARAQVAGGRAAECPSLSV